MGYAMKKQLVFAALVIVALGAALAYHFLPQMAERKVSSERQKKAEIVIGAILPMTGTQALSGQEESRGLILAVERLNAEYPNTTFTLKIEDSKGLPKEAITAAERLKSDQNLKCVFTSLTGTSQAVMPLVPAERALTFVLAMDEALVHDHKNAFRIYPGIREEGREILNIVHSMTPQPKKVALITLDQAAINAQAEEILLPALQGQNIEVLYERFKSVDSSGYKAIAGKVATFQADMIIFNAYYNHMPSALRVLAESGVDEKTKIVGGFNLALALNDPAFITPFSLTWLAVPQYQRKVSESRQVTFVDEYRKHWSGSPTVDTAYSYDGAMVCGQVIFTSNGYVKQAGKFLLSGQKFSGVTGDLSFDTEGRSLSKWLSAKINPEEKGSRRFEQ
jgi:branched-chain amino acid transport system substrate-binding protein